VPKILDVRAEIIMNEVKEHCSEIKQLAFKDY
jgi:hypothetical protein